MYCTQKNKGIMKQVVWGKVVIFNVYLYVQVKEALLIQKFNYISILQ